MPQKVVPDVSVADPTETEYQNFNYGSRHLSFVQINNYLDILKKSLLDFINPQAEQKSGRAVQLFMLTFFGILAFAGIMVQVYSEAEMLSDRLSKHHEFQYNEGLSNSIYDLVALLGREMEVVYENNNGSYEHFLQKSQDVMREVDTNLMWITQWPSSEALEAIAPEIRDSLSSPTTLRAAIRIERDLRKAAVNGVAETSVLAFYVTLIDELSALGRGFALSMPRFPKWGDFMAITPAFQMWMNYKKYITVAIKIVSENRTLSTSDPIVQMMNLYYCQYVEYVKISGMTSTLAQEKLTNLTSLDVSKNVDEMHDVLFNEGPYQLNEKDFTDQAVKHDQNIEWLFHTLREHVHSNVISTLAIWPTSDVFSAPMFAIAVAISFATIFVHVIATKKVQRQVVKYRDNVRDLQDTLVFIYDYIPKNFVDKARSGIAMPIQQFEDTCIMVMDICNIEELTADLKLESFVAVMEDTYDVIEKMLRKYSCFKVDIGGSYFVLGSGAGGYHLLDHVLELVLVALELQDAVAEMSNMDKEDDYDVRLRIGLHVGPCYGRVVQLRVPRMAFVGGTTQLAALIHATSLPVSVQVSEAVTKRLQNITEELDFYRRGSLIVGNECLTNLYWVRWADENARDQADRQSDTGSVADIITGQ